MPEKKHARSTPISDSEILAMYQSVLPFLYDNPEDLDVTNEINKLLLPFIYYDFYHTLMDTPEPEHLPSRMSLTFETWGASVDRAVTPTVSITQSVSEDPDALFDDAVERSYRYAIATSKVEHPDEKKFDYYRMESRKYPRIMIGFFRHLEPDRNRAFTLEEKKIFDQLTPHLFLLFRCALNQRAQSQAFQYFDGFAKLGSKLASEHDLSEMEVRMVPNILFGYSNEEIAERQYISVSTVKSHIGHILKKTGTKNRVDFLAKFFTSPEHVSL
jgi:DNA-binding CsgD family transcriptional regulator